MGLDDTHGLAGGQAEICVVYIEDMMVLFFVGSARHPRISRRTSRNLCGLDRRHDGVVFFLIAGCQGS